EEQPQVVIVPRREVTIPTETNGAQQLVTQPLHESSNSQQEFIIPQPIPDAHVVDDDWVDDDTEEDFDTPESSPQPQRSKTSPPIETATTSQQQVVIQTSAGDFVANIPLGETDIVIPQQK
ncbi:unnamed protein product, partial [Allacma fusca]